MTVPFPDGVGYMDNVEFTKPQWEVLTKAYYGGTGKVSPYTRKDTLRKLRSYNFVSLAGLDLTQRGRDLIRWHEEGAT